MERNKIALLYTAYLAPIQYYSKLFQYDSICIEHYEHFPKQTFRNRCLIYGANGVLTLSIPLKKYKEKTITKDIKIAYDYPWQKNHWRSLQSAYRCSPYFEFYEHELFPFFNKNYTYLIDFNEALQTMILNLLNINVKIKSTENYLKQSPECDDLRVSISPKKNEPGERYICKTYIQVFESKYGFIPNLSIVDLLFNQGPLSIDYIRPHGFGSI